MLDFWILKVKYVQKNNLWVVFVWGWMREESNLQKVEQEFLEVLAMGRVKQASILGYYMNRNSWFVQVT